MEKSVQKLDFSSYDLVLISSSGFAHGAKISSPTKSLVYYHAPARYLWDWTHEYRKNIRMDSGLRGFLFGKLLLRLRLWDYHSGQKQKNILANSATTASRIEKYYRRSAPILYPPIETERFAKKLPSEKSQKLLQEISSSLEEKYSQDTLKNIFSSDSYYIILSALTEFKRLDVAIKNFLNFPDIPLIIIGKGEYQENLENLSQGAKNIFFA